ncbi:CU044_2847 family protein [Streptomyces sp. BE303]|uniref:CU044_2847 family protein n=1 Tax=Streptomyces sp. BE303 TaxID=3002528 RepID=UPI002E77C847|nr:CU044_2847 family protein [Streptomyces sp. BE303]MED7947867.1 CU044_2847 family protein [Streptomyces sp. BE303]
MTTRTEFTLASGGMLVVESESTGAGVAPAGRGSLERAGATVRDSLHTVVNTASDVIDAFRALPRRPDEIEVGFGVKLDGSVGVILAGGTAGVHFNVTLRWSPEEPAGEADEEE